MEDSTEFRRRSTPGRPASIAGYMPVDDDKLQHSGVRGGRSYCLCVGIIFLLVIALLNALVTAGLIYFMAFRLSGMQSVEFIPGHNVVRILENLAADTITVDHIYSPDQLDIAGASVAFKAGADSKVFFDSNHTVFTTDDFKLMNMEGKSLFATNVPFDLDLYQVKNLKASMVEVGSIESSSRYDGLHVQSFNDLTLIGMEGVQIETDNQIQVKSGDDISVTSRQGSITLESPDSISLNPDLPVEGKSITPTASGQYKLCVCMPSGKLFTVPIQGPDSGCHKASEDKNPCDED